MEGGSPLPPWPEAVAEACDPPFHSFPRSTWERKSATLRRRAVDEGFPRSSLLAHDGEAFAFGRSGQALIQADEVQRRRLVIRRDNRRGKLTGVGGA